MGNFRRLLAVSSRTTCWVLALPIFIEIFCPEVVCEEQVQVAELFLRETEAVGMGALVLLSTVGAEGTRDAYALEISEDLIVRS